MYERFIFMSSLEREATRQLVLDNFPLAHLNFVTDPLACDFLLDMNLAVEQAIFFRWVAITPGPARLLLYSCLNLSLDLHNPPRWMVEELRRLQFRLTDGRIF